MRQSLFWIAGFFLWVLPVQAQIDVAAQLDSNDIMIGDQVHLEILVTTQPGVFVQAPDLTPLDTSQTIEVLATSAWDTVSRSPNLLLRQQLTLTSFEPGEHLIPAIDFRYKRGTVGRLIRSNPLVLRVRDIPPAQDPNELMPIKPILEEPLNWQDTLPYLLGALALGLLLAVVLLLIRRRRQTEIAPAPAVIVPAHELALQKLRALREKKLWQKGESKAFQSELSYILREYFENRFQLPALEMTSSEILRQLRTLDLNPAWEGKLKDVFQIADLVKFAKAEPTASLHDQAMTTVEEFIHETTPAPDPVESAAAINDEPGKREEEDEKQN